MMRLFKLFVACVVLFCFFPLCVNAETVTPTYIVDGDTFKVGKEKFRLECVDAYELLQASGKGAKDALSTLILNKTVEVTKTKKDMYGRWLVIVHVDGVDVADLLVRNGWAVPYYFGTKNCKAQYAGALSSAQLKKAGAWGMVPVPDDPYIFRKNILKTYGK